MANAIDFTSALYLGLRYHDIAAGPACELTTGRPAKLGVPRSTRQVASSLAILQGFEDGILMPSTLHVFMDLFQTLMPEGIRVFIDAGAYPIARRAAEVTGLIGPSPQIIPHYDPPAAERVLRANRATGLRPVLLTDGFCPDCGQAAPLSQYLRAVAPFNGLVVLDDTQALGIWGENPDKDHPFGIGGGGSPRLHGIISSSLISGCSLAKALGAPVAGLCGPAEVIQRVRRTGTMWEHASPPSSVSVVAANRSLSLNAQAGDRLRNQLAHNVMYFQRGIQSLGLQPNGTLFPVQSVDVRPYVNPKIVHQTMQVAGVQTILLRNGSEPGRLVFIVTAEHREQELRRAIQVLGNSL